MADTSLLKELMNQFPYSGKVKWIGIRPGRREEMLSIQSVEAKIGSGLVGDRYNGKSDSKRQVTLIQNEHIISVANFLRYDEIYPGLLRRNIVVEEINLLSLKDKEFSIGTCRLEMTGLCHPCSRMEENLCVGGYNAMRGHGGITARVVKEGIINVGDLLIVNDIK